MTNFVVVVPYRNAWPWLGACLVSLSTQVRTLGSVGVVDVVVVDDASDDDTTEMVSGWCLRRGWRYLHNETSLKMPHNLRLALDAVPAHPDDVVLIVDGDDWLPHPNTLASFAHFYQDPDLWLTWGQYTRWPDPAYMPNPARPYPPEVETEVAYRGHDYESFNHPIAFRRHLWDHITDADLQDDDGHWFTAGYDKAIMLPMLELSGPDHHRCLDGILYVYNEQTVLSEAKTRPDDCVRTETILRVRPPKAQL